MECKSGIDIDGGSGALETPTDQQSPSCMDGDGSSCDVTADDGGNSAEFVPSDHRMEILKALESVERDSVSIAESFTSLFASLRDTLSQASSTTVDHMNCFSDAAGHLQECVLEASAKGNRLINSCLRLNEEMKGMDALAARIKVLRRHVDALDYAVNRLAHFP